MKPEGVSAVMIQIPRDAGQAGWVGLAAWPGRSAVTPPSTWTEQGWMGKAVSEHPTFLGWEHGLHPQLQGQAGVLQIDFALKVDSILPSSPGPQTPPLRVTYDTETLCASPSGKGGVMCEQHPSLQPAHAGLHGGDGS